jgi:TetR/AcrR family transcriptional repressor of lmrAB and yxaGH operons
MTATRDQIIETTCGLLEAQGYHATGLNQILSESGAPRGSLYYYFPEGKEELAAEAIHKTAETLVAHIRQTLASVEDPVESIGAFVSTLAQQVEASGFRGGGPLTTVAIETATTSERLNTACREAYQQLERVFEDRLVMGGFAEERAAPLATFIIAAIEGGIILSRTYHTGDPLRHVADQLGDFLETIERG